MENRFHVVYYPNYDQYEVENDYDTRKKFDDSLLSAIIRILKPIPDKGPSVVKFSTASEEEAIEKYKYFSETLYCAVSKRVYDKNTKCHFTKYGVYRLHEIPESICSEHVYISSNLEKYKAYCKIEDWKQGEYNLLNANPDLPF
jgi:hypothetical protein